MINILLKSNIAEIKKNYLYSFISILFLFVAITIFILMILLSPTYFTNFVNGKELKSQIDSFTILSEQDNKKTYFDLVGDINSKTNLFILDNISFSYLVEDIKSEAEKNNLSLNNVRYENNPKTQERTITIKGNASARSNVISFSQAIKSLPIIESVDVPVSQFTSGENIEATVIAKLTKR